MQKNFEICSSKPTLRMKDVTGKIQTGLFNSCLNTVFQMTVLKISSWNDCISCSSLELAAQQLVYNPDLVTVT